jgi:hypothetical protein
MAPAPTRRRRTPTAAGSPRRSRKEFRQGGGDQNGPQTSKARLSPADIAELAEGMHVPEGIMHMVLRHYPELARPLVRHRALIA